MSDLVNISGLSKAKVLAALYNGSKPQGLGFMHFDEKPMTVDAAQAILDRGQIYFDYLQGRVMKIDLSEDMVSPLGYDRDNGQGAVQHIINELRHNDDVNAEGIERLHLENTLNSALNLQDELYQPTKVDGDDGNITSITLGYDYEVSDFLAPILIKLIGEELSGDALIRAILNDSTISEEEVQEIIEEDATDVKSHGWYLVKTNPQSDEAKRITGQLVTIVAINSKDQTASVFTMSVFKNKGGVSVTVPLTDLTNR